MAPNTNITMAHIADKLGVTRSAVSAVLSGGKSTTVVSEATRKRILETARNLRFKPNILGRSLAYRRSFSLALLCRESLFNQVSEIILGIQDVIYDRDYSLLTYFHGDTVENEAVHIRRCMEKRVDGLIVMPALDADGTTSQKLFSELYEQGTPVVQLFGHVLSDIPSVLSDSLQCGRLATRHLLDLGHRRIAFLAEDVYQDEHIEGYHSDLANRVKGYQNAMFEHGLEPIIITHPRAQSRLEFFQVSMEGVHQILAHPSKPTAVVAYNDYEALGLMKALQINGISVPRDISLIGSDDIEAASLSVPALTTLHRSLRQKGKMAARMVFDMLEGKKVTNIILEREVLVRESTSSPKSE